MNILIDTDIGGDVDDALAVALALCSPNIHISGITLVYIDNTWRQGVITELLDIFVRPAIPIVRGAEKPLIGHWAYSGTTWIPPNIADNTAAEFIIKQCDADPQLILVPIGPLTNIAAAISAAPRIAKNRKITIMGGAPGQSRAEWNIFCDPEAAAIVFSSGAVINLVGLNVTEQCQFTNEEVEAFANGNEKSKYLYQLMTKFISDYNYLPILHDPLAMASLINNDVLTFEPRNIAVEVSDIPTRGYIINTPSGADINIATHVNVERFKQNLIKSFT